MPTPLQVLNKRRQKREQAAGRDQRESKADKTTASEGTTPKEPSSIRSSLGVSELPTIRNDALILYKV